MTRRPVDRSTGRPRGRWGGADLAGAADAADEPAGRYGPLATDVTPAAGRLDVRVRYLVPM